MNVEEASRFGSKKERKLTSLTNIQKKELYKNKCIGNLGNERPSVSNSKKANRFSKTAYLRNFL